MVTKQNLRGVNTAISRKVVGKSARYNPERYCGWLWIHCSSKNFERMTREAMDIGLRVLKKSNKSRFDSYSVRNNVSIISLLPFGSVGCIFFLTAFLEIPVILLGRSSHGKVATAVTSHQCSPSVSRSIHTILWYFVSSLSRRFRLVARFPYAMEKMYVCSASTQNKTSW